MPSLSFSLSVPVSLSISTLLALTLTLGCAKPNRQRTVDPDRGDARADVSADTPASRPAPSGDVTAPESETAPAGDVPHSDPSVDVAGADAGSTCLNGQVRCVGNAVEACAGDVWVAKDLCPAVCSAGACVGKCKPGDKRCGANHTPETCDGEGEFTPGARCPFACAAGACVGDCVPGSKRCGGVGGKTVELCGDDGRFVAGAACANLCANGSCGGSCQPGQRRCGANQIPETCSAEGTWTPGAACDFVCQGDGVCGGECKAGDRRCGGTGNLIPETCSAAGRWTPAAACPFVCMNGACRGSCTPGARRCNGETSETCNATGAWGAAQACPFVCTAGGSCTGVCKPRSKRCTGQTPETCDDSGTWRAGAACAFSCSGGTCVAACTSGDKRCAPNGGAVQTCKPDGSGWVDADRCGAFGCNTGLKVCHVCDPGKATCDGTTAVRCNAAGTMASSDACGGRGCRPSNASCCETGTKWDGLACRRPCSQDNQCGTCEECGIDGYCQARTGSRCEGGTTLVTCTSGKETRMPCASGKCNGTACTPCGDSGQGCCVSGNKCSNGDLVCVEEDGICAECGRAGQPCCAGRVCKGEPSGSRQKCGLKNARWQCVHPCGTDGERCCDSNPKCNAGLSCIPEHFGEGEAGCRP